MILYIDTTSEKIIIKLLSKEGVCRARIEWVSQINHSKELLVKIEELIKKNKITKDQISAVAVNRGPGSYTGLRVGITTANLLAFALNVPIFGTEEIGEKIFLFSDQNFSEPVMPVYAGEPHITKKKR